MNKLKQFLCGLTNHKFKSNDTNCKFDWLSKMQPVLQRSNVKINLVRKEH